MKKLSTVLMVIATAMLLTPTAHATDEPLEQLAGSWRAVQLGETVPPDDLLMYITFLDHETLKWVVVAEEGSEEDLVRYTATTEGSITFFSDPENAPDGETYTWAIDGDGRLVIDAVAEDSDMVMIFTAYTLPATGE